MNQPDGIAHHGQVNPVPEAGQRRTVYVVRGRPANNDRGPLPPGHPLSWGAINAGTVLDGAGYPFPIFG